MVIQFLVTMHRAHGFGGVLAEAYEVHNPQRATSRVTTQIKGVCCCQVSQLQDILCIIGLAYRIRLLH